MVQAASLCWMTNMTNCSQISSVSFLGGWVNKFPLIQHLFSQLCSEGNPLSYSFVFQQFFGKNISKPKKKTTKKKPTTKDVFTFPWIMPRLGLSCQISPFSQFWPVSIHLALEMVFEKSFKNEIEYDDHCKVILFIFPALLGNSWYRTLCKFKV